MNSSNVPSSITFGKKILYIPTLEEVGIPLAGLSTVLMEKELLNRRWNGGYWVNRGEKLLTYNYYAFIYEKLNFFDRIRGIDPTTSVTFTITSPISGLVIANRDEDSVDPNGANGLRYEYCKEKSLPIILVPNDESLPDENNFYEYDSVASWLKHYFPLLPFRDRSNISAGRLKDYMARNESAAKAFSKDREMLINRKSENYKDYLIKEITADDFEVIRNLEKARNEFVDLRDKLVHLTRRFGKSIGDESKVNSNETYDIGLSFAGEQREYVEQVAEKLKQDGIKVFYDSFEEIDLWGKDLYQHLNEVYKRKCEYCIIFISEHYSKKLWTKHELKSAQARAFQENKEYILPIRFDNTELPGLNDTIGYINANEKSPEQIAELAKLKLRR